jgi:hypothetical protein
LTELLDAALEDVLHVDGLGEPGAGDPERMERDVALVEARHEFPAPDRTSASLTIPRPYRSGSERRLPLCRFRPLVPAIHLS